MSLTADILLIHRDSTVSIKALGRGCLPPPRSPTRGTPAVCRDPALLAPALTQHLGCIVLNL